MNHRRLQQPGQPGGLPKRAGYGASIATMRLATSAIAKVHELAGHESPGRDQGARASLKGRGRQLARPQRQASTLTADVLAVICLTAIQPRLRGRGLETPEQAAQREKFDVALVAVLSDAELCRSEASSLTVATCSAGTTAATASPWPVQDRHRSPWRRVVITPAATRALDAIRPAAAAGDQEVFGLSES